jgi:hypothetical protein
MNPQRVPFQPQSPSHGLTSDETDETNVGSSKAARRDASSARFLIISSAASSMHCLDTHPAPARKREWGREKDLEFGVVESGLNNESPRPALPKNGTLPLRQPALSIRRTNLDHASASSCDCFANDDDDDDDDDDDNDNDDDDVESLAFKPPTKLLPPSF